VPFPNAAVAAEDITASPAWFPLESGGPGVTRLVRLDETAYRAASFLDQRILRTHREQAQIPSAVVAGAAARLAPGAHYIFHIGHVGSTLVSRLIGEYSGFFSIREPALLREIAANAAQDYAANGIDLRGTLSLLARTWRPGQRAVVKATSFVSEVAGSILEIDRSALAILVFTPALAYLRCILAGPNSRVEIKSLVPSRLARLRKRVGEIIDIHPRSEGEWIAMSWLCEMVCLQQTASRFASRIFWADFDRFLAAPHAGLGSMLRVLGADVTPKETDNILSRPLMHQYSKAPGYPYDAALRREVLASAQSGHSAEIRRGMDWLARLAGHQLLIDELPIISPKVSE
jgi:hypothetical protein